MQYIELVAILAVIQFFAFGALTGRARRLSGLQAPAIIGNEKFERMYRVQTNTLELLIAFLPALFLAGKYWPTPMIVITGFVYLIGRHIYWRAYARDPSKRGVGFMLSMIPTLILIILALPGILKSL